MGEHELFVIIFVGKKLTRGGGVEIGFITLFVFTNSSKKQKNKIRVISLFVLFKKKSLFHGSFP